jgi:hypothetical protein
MSRKLLLNFGSCDGGRPFEMAHDAAKWFAANSPAGRVVFVTESGLQVEINRRHENEWFNEWATKHLEYDCYWQHCMPSPRD